MTADPPGSRLLAALGASAAEDAERWEAEARLPHDLLARLGKVGLLCAEVPADFGGLGLSGAETGELTAEAGAISGSLRSVMTSQGIAAWTIRRWGDRAQRDRLLHRLTAGTLAAVAFTEPSAGSDLNAMATRIRPADHDADVSDRLLVTGHKTWVTAAAYADLILVFGQYDAGPASGSESGPAAGSEIAAAVVPADAPGVEIRPIPDPFGCRAAGHCAVSLQEVAIPRESLVRGSTLAPSMLVTSALTYGRLSVAWGCAGILRACLDATVRHARSREQFGVKLSGHQLVARHIAELVVAERTVTRLCEHAAHSWDTASPDVVVDAVLAKHAGADHAARGAAAAMQVLASAGAHDQHVVARAYRDAKLMEIIEGTAEICQLLLADHAMSGRPEPADHTMAGRPEPAAHALDAAT